MIYRYLDCGDLRHGFARVKCKDCGHEYLLAFSCKRRHFCPSCHQKRVVEFGEWLCLDVLKKAPHRHFIFSIPKILRRYFLYDRKLLAGLSRCAWESLKLFIQQAVPEKAPLPGAVIAVQTFGDFPGFNPHCHILVTDGCFYGERGMFRVAPPLELKKLEAIFRHKVFRTLLKKGKITEGMVRMLSACKHSGFNIFCGNRRSPDDTAMENLVRYIIRASFSQERMRYLEHEGTVIYTAKACPGHRSGDGRASKTFPALEWLAAMCSHIPNRGEQMVRYYGYYSNVARGKRKETGQTDDAIPCILEPEGNAKAFRKNWARLIQKIYEVDPLICPKCKGAMCIIRFIEDQSVIREILMHPGLRLIRSRPPPKIHDPPGREDVAADLQIQPQSEIIYGDPEYSWDDYIYPEGHTQS